MIKATAAIGGARGVEIIAALVRQKAIAVFLGEAGIGVLSVIRNVIDLLIQLPLLGMDMSSVKFISSYAAEDDKEGIQRVVSTTLWAAIINVPIVILVYSLLAPWHISRNLEDGGRFLPILYMALLSAPFASGAASFGAFLIGFKQVGRCTTLIVISSLLTLCLGVPLIVAGACVGLIRDGVDLFAWSEVVTAVRSGSEEVMYYGLWGAAIGLVVLQAMNLILYSWNFSRVFPIVLRAFSLKTMRLMSGVAAANWLGGTLSLTAFLVVRGHLAKSYGNESAGLFQPIYAMCAQYLAPLSHALIFYTYPRMSELRQYREVVEEINSTLRVVLLLSTPAMVLMATAVKPLLVLLFTAKFVAAAVLLPFMLLGEWFRLPMRTMGMALLGQRRVKAYILFDLLFYIILIVVTLTMSDFFFRYARVTDGETGEFSEYYMTLAPCVGYLLGALVGTVGYYLTVNRNFGYRLDGDNKRLAYASLVVLGVTLFCTPEGGKEIAAAAAKVAMLALWALLVVRPSEWRKASAVLADWWRRSRETR